jgi:FkbM family methyltransferase
MDPTGGGLRVFFRKKPKDVTVEHAYYKVGEDCQIPHLDWLYEKCFGRIEDGLFVEVGAFDGEYVSNTCFLADMGWRGCYIEPVPAFHEKCRLRHATNKGVTVDRLAIGPVNGEAEITLAGPLSSIDETTTEIFRGLPWARNHVSDTRVRVPQQTLDDYLAERQVVPGFELLVIDVEGYERDVLAGVSLEKWRPRMVIIELHDQNMQYRKIMSKSEEIVRIFDRAGYIAVYKDFTNTVYVLRA